VTRDQPPLAPLHGIELLSSSKLTVFERLDTETLKASLALGQEHCLKARPDGTMLDGHHWIHVLRMRQVDVDALPREVIVPEDRPS
jgi:hypothetical protein